MVTGESVDIVPHRNPEDAAKFTPQYASLVLFNSFRHSQGVPTMQSDIFSYVHIVTPELRITRQEKPKVLELSQKMILSFLYGKGHERKGIIALHDSYPPKEKAVVAIHEELDEMQRKFNDKEKPSPVKRRELIKKIADVIIHRDLEFLDREDGRNKIPNDSRKPFMDSWLSYTVHFGLNKNSTRVPELDEMYRDIRAFITRPGAEKNQKLTEILKIYRRKHPGVKINLSP